MQDVDQRLTRDVERLCDDLAALIPSMVKPVVDIAWFSVQLYQLTGRRGMAILYLYAFLGFGALSAVTPNFGALAKKVRHPGRALAANIMQCLVNVQCCLVSKAGVQSCHTAMLWSHSPNEN